ncbi:hypothetical protein PUN28_012417 [Cardiocondyla obscurior]|uniref:Secreted protein n=1 Tax=Cardiocondyla obscurior TaxID=286306 RepID=A0AAW2FBJ8_9HYME
MIVIILITKASCAHIFFNLRTQRGSRGIKFHLERISHKVIYSSGSADRYPWLFFRYYSLLIFQCFQCFRKSLKPLNLFLIKYLTHRTQQHTTFRLTESSEYLRSVFLRHIPDRSLTRRY